MSRYSSSDLDQSTLSVKRVFKGIVISFILLLIVSITIGFIVVFINIDDLIIQRVLIIFNYLSILVAAFLTGLNVEGNGWLNGSLVGLGHILLILVFSLMWVETLFTVGSLIMITLGSVTGLIGGMAGINFKD
ncbi:TIGR04086 family membrane protein [Sporohalobacter salinus]|uniref:TIGR04086 family membrane protein n=1 Tax=Sporohalobacter salinus TaxID=1494606 RepID=UPI0019601E05|nr:TIGR04086 family membrane protein [Sporohalobacter salinus]MBM7623439.1 putative membrane protein (TIGR04086 family) [Sporohalobacter salinus]